jgi:DNA-directed RNA polymerase subunit RPC12/RpoP
MMEALDGNAIAGPLLEHFGVEMTTTSGVCAHCGASAVIAELVVYLCAPGAVARCPSCGQVVLVVLSPVDHPRVDHRAFAL